MQFYQTCRIPDETKKILGPKINPPNFQALISPSPEIFPWRINVRISKCLWLVYSSYHPLNFTFSHLTVWTARPALYACGNSYLNQAARNGYRYLYFPKFPIPNEIRWWKSSKQKRNPIIISVTSTLPSQSNPRQGSGLGSNIIVCIVLFGCW